ncbi:MAG: glycerophosphodiester phosphodiesterase family protein [Gammaproteobacteria bacterium]|nr:glycerophosphodiester phosphodiesterase family protein [Gammaproteobacteria bacterium]
MRQNRLVAHRGYPNAFPENTLIGYQAAVAAGARFVELDVQLSADRIPVLFHDRDMLRLCGHDGKIGDYTIARLSQFKAGYFDRFGYRYAQNPITRLDEFVSWLRKQPALTAFVEIKRISLEQFGVDTVVKTIIDVIQPAERQCVLISYSLDALAHARKLGWSQVGAVIDDWKGHESAAVRSLAPQYFFCDYATLPRFGKLIIPGIKTAVYETTDTQLAIRLMDRGIDLVETFEIRDMVDTVSSV